ncbi:SdpI family protein [Ekhidna sp.]|uniref:SdpI family protein n=1 Tax=Ekhidna sp. TaxID=2608089 RepID=UPI003BAD4F44
MSSTMIIVNLAIGPLLLILSLLFKVFPPKKINWAYGYRTKRSMKSQEAWEASNRYSADLMMWVAIITTVSQVILYYLFEPATALLIACVIMSLLLVSTLFVVERFLKENFDSEGKKPDPA